MLQVNCAHRSISLGPHSVERDDHPSSLGKECAQQTGGVNSYASKGPCCVASYYRPRCLGQFHADGKSAIKSQIMKDDQSFRLGKGPCRADWDDQPVAATMTWKSGPFLDSFQLFPVHWKICDIQPAMSILEPIIVSKFSLKLDQRIILGKLPSKIIALLQQNVTAYLTDWIILWINVIMSIHSIRQWTNLVPLIFSLGVADLKSHLLSICSWCNMPNLLQATRLVYQCAL